MLIPNEVPWPVVAQKALRAILKFFSVRTDTEGNLHIAYLMGLISVSDCTAGTCEVSGEAVMLA